MSSDLKPACPAARLMSEGGGGFNPHVKPTRSTWALAPEERFSGPSYATNMSTET
jgi:hypothetical protein